MLEQRKLPVIEDDVDGFGCLMRKALERAGYEVRVCATAEDGLLALNQCRFDLITVGQILSSAMTGLDFLESIRRAGNTMVTGFSDDAEFVRRVHRAGALDFLFKDPQLTFLAALPHRVREALQCSRTIGTNPPRNDV